MFETAVPTPGGSAPVITGAPSGRGAVDDTVAMAEHPSVGAAGTAGAALTLRDQALAALDAGCPTEAIDLVTDAQAVLIWAGLGGGPDEAAVLVARAEIEEALDRFGAARATIGAAIALLGGDAGPGDADLDLLAVWCQAQERQAGLERLAGDFPAAAGRLTGVLDTASAAFGEESSAVTSAANALGVVYKYAGDFDAARAAYSRALAAAGGLADADPLTQAALLHNLAGLAHSQGDPVTGIPLAERGLAVRVSALGSAHPDVARDHNALGALYHLAGRHRAADHAYGRPLGCLSTATGPITLRSP